MAFNREDLITWNELAPSFQTIIKALQSEITNLTQTINTTKTVEGMVQFYAAFKRHELSDHPHPNAINALLRQPNTKYKVGDIVYDTDLPPYCILECTQAGTTASDESNTNIGQIPSSVYNEYDTVDKVRAEIADFYVDLEKHIVSNDSHPNATNFLIRQYDTEYDLGTVVFDAGLPVTQCLECTRAGISGDDPNMSEEDLIDPPDIDNMSGATEEIARLNVRLEEHVNSTNPHTALSFLTRQPQTSYQKKQCVFIPGKNARYYLECTQAGTTGTEALA